MNWPRLKLVCLIVLLLCVLLTSFLFVRRDQLDRAARALKESKGVAALSHLKPFAIIGDSTAQVLCGYIYAFGWGGVEKNDASAIYWLKRSEPFIKTDGNTNVLALHELAVGMAYSSGSQGVKMDKAERTKWLQRAARDGNKEASEILAHDERTRN